MGDRGEVVLIESGVPDNALPIRIYTHWGATELPQTVAMALDRGRGRWGDESYLNRIIFSEMIRHEVMSDLGYGLSIGESYAWRIVTVNHINQTVAVTEVGEWSFDDFVKAFI
jgi:hypothetical protein